MRKQAGFTLIELVIVVVILGFLAATAIPKFVDLTDQAKQASVEGMAGGFATGVSLARAQWEAESRPSDTDSRNVVNYDGTLVYLTTEDDGNDIRPGYIIMSENSDALSTTININDVDCLDVWYSIFQAPPRATDLMDDSGNDDGINGDNGGQYDYFVSKESIANDPVCHYYLKESLNRNGDDYNNPSNSTLVGDSFTYKPANSEVIVYIND